MIITFSPPLPCGNRLQAATLCGQPATVGFATRLGARWEIVPVCRDCTRRCAALYERQAGGADQERDGIEPEIE